MVTTHLFLRNVMYVHCLHQEKKLINLFKKGAIWGPLLLFIMQMLLLAFCGQRPRMLIATYSPSHRP